MRILLTGSSGFLGGVFIKEWQNDHEILTLGRSKENLISIDLSKEVPVLPAVELIVHTAGKAHVVPKTQAEKQEFLDVNVRGTAHLLKGIKQMPRLFVFISTVAVYGLEKGLEVSEDSPANGGTPYGNSKIEAENLILEWGSQNGVDVVILRLPLIAGPNPPGNLGAMIKAIRAGYYFRLGEGRARKSIVLASDVAHLILRLLGKEGIYNLNDGCHPSLAELDLKIASHMGKTIWSLPEKVIRPFAKLGDKIPIVPINTYRIQKLSHTLTFSDQKARKELGWNPRPVLENLF